MVLRPDGKSTAQGQADNGWDFLFNQAGMVGSGILFPNGACGDALEHFPPRSVTDVFAVSFVKAVEPASEETGSGAQTDALQHEGLTADQASATRAARNVVSKIAKLKVNRRDFDAQGQALQKTNVVYASAVYEADLVATWVPNSEEPGSICTSNCHGVGYGGVKRRERERERARET